MEVPGGEHRRLRSSPDRRAASARRSRAGWRSDGLAVAVLDLNADSCADTVKSITDAPAAGPSP